MRGCGSREHSIPTLTCIEFARPTRVLSPAAMLGGCDRAAGLVLVAICWSSAAGSLAASYNPDLPYQPFELVVLEAALKEVRHY